MMRADSSSLGRPATCLTVLFLVALACPPGVAGDESEPPTAWTEDPPQMTTDKVLSIEKRDDDYAGKFQELLETLISRQAGPFTPPAGEELVKKTSLLTDFRRPDEKPATLGDVGRLIRSKDNGSPSHGQQASKVEASNILKFLSAQDIHDQDLNEEMHGREKKIPMTSHHSSSESKTTRSNTEADPQGVSKDDSKDNAAAKTSLAGSPVLTGAGSGLSVVPGGDVLGILPEISVVRMRESPPGNIIRKLLEEAVEVLHGANMAGDPFLDMIERHRADLARGVIPQISPIDDPSTNSGFLHRALGVKTVIPSNYEAGYRKDLSRELNRSKRDFPKTVVVKANETQGVISRNVSSRVNDTPGQDKRPAPEEELKISRIGYIIFEKDGKIKEAKEASVSELAKGANRTEKPQRTHRKKIIQTCRHGNFIHAIGQPPHDAQRPGADIEPASGVGKQVEIRVPGSTLGSDGKVAFPSGEIEKALSPNSIEVLTIREDIGKGMPKKDFTDWYEVQGNAMSGKDHRHSSVLSAFHVLLITAICILTFVTILYLSSRIRSDNGGPRRLNSHTALFEPNTKYERY